MPKKTKRVSWVSIGKRIDKFLKKRPSQEKELDWTDKLIEKEGILRSKVELLIREKKRLMEQEKLDKEKKQLEIKEQELERERQKEGTTAEAPEEPTADYEAFDNFIEGYVTASTAKQMKAIAEGVEKFGLTKTEANEILKDKVAEVKAAAREERSREENVNKELAKAKLEMLEEEWETAEDELFQEIFDIDYKKAQYYFAKRLDNENHFRTFKDNGDIINYEAKQGIYSQKADIFIAQECKRRLADKATDYTVKEITNSIRRSSYIEREILNEQPKHLKPVGNGLLNTETKKLETFTPEYIFLNKINICYVETASCIKFQKFLNQILPEIEVQILQEWFGYCLLNDVRFQKALLFYGDGANGKSVLLKVIKYFLGAGSVTNIALQYLETNQFAAARLFGKAANIFFDLPSKALAQTSNFKTVVAGDPISGEKKGKDSFEFLPFCKMMFSCNEVPRSPDRTPAFFRRWIIMIFNERFPEGDPRRIENLEEQFFQQEEMEGILMWAVEGLTRLRKQKGFTRNMNAAQVQDFWLRHSDSIASFYLDMIEEDQEGQETKWDVFNAYEKYCQIRGYTDETQNAFWRRFKEICNYSEHQPKAKDGKQTKSVRGIRLLENFEATGAKNA